MDNTLTAALERTAARFCEALVRELVALGCEAPVETRVEAARVTVGLRDTALRAAALGRSGVPPDDRFRQAVLRTLRTLRRAHGGEDR